MKPKKVKIELTHAEVIAMDEFFDAYSGQRLLASEKAKIPNAELCAMATLKKWHIKKLKALRWEFPVGATAKMTLDEPVGYAFMYFLEAHALNADKQLGNKILQITNKIHHTLT